MVQLALIIDLILLGGVISIQAVMWFIYQRNYRFATILFDMLPFYPYIIGGNIVLHVIFFLIIGEVIVQIILIISLLTTVFQLSSFIIWNKDYRLSKYREMLQDFKNNPDIEFIRVQDYIKTGKIDKEKINILIRHDVDIDLKRTVNMIRVERELGVPACYYFRMHAERFSFEEVHPIIEDIKDDPLFEVGFHYESISAVNGDIQAAPGYFEEELEMFRDIYPNLVMIAAHGDKYYNSRLVNQDLLDMERLNIISAYKLAHDHYISEIGGNRRHGSGDEYDRFVNRMKSINNLPKGSLVQILVHADWWF